MSNTEVLHPFRPYAEYTWCAPFWMRAVFIPPSVRKNQEGLSDRELALSQLAGLVGKHRFNCVSRWNTENLQSTAEPYRLQRQRDHRLVAELAPDEYLLQHVKGKIPGRYADIDVRPISTRLYFEDYGLGVFEAVLALSGDPLDLEAWNAFLTDREFWSEMDFFSTTLNGELAIQKCWPDLRAAFAKAIPESGLTPFLELEEALDGVVGQELMSSNDFLWTQCMDLTLFWNPQLDLTPNNIKATSTLLHRIGLTADYTQDTRNEVAKAVNEEADSGAVETLSVYTRAYGIATGDNMFISMYNGFGMVALVNEPEPWRSSGTNDVAFDFGTSPSRKIAALRRALLLNYGAMTTASNVLKQFLTKSLTSSGRNAAELHEDLRRVTAAFSSLKHDARCELIEADDIEAYVYKAMFEMWNLPSQISLLNETIDDADKAASRLSESNIHNEERTFTLILIVLTVVTILGIASEVTDFVMISEEFKATVTGFFDRLIILTVFLAAAIGLAISLASSRQWRRSIWKTARNRRR
ncbi:hypothetical protein [Acidisphaera sp. S103]|uniref:hypothetical protein n=1 Tax=Acidisphaera sp. S103 TaxID=1747223 RepID=UPI00131C1722|nr:hypothetical protein [Acidisphaera sp. S103]